ncbi:MAG: hypothetical protein ACTHKR_09830 [Sphingomonas sp.]
MRGILKSGFFWRFLGGFAIGTVGVVAMHPGAIAHGFHHSAQAMPAAR